MIDISVKPDRQLSEDELRRINDDINQNKVRSGVINERRFCIRGSAENCINVMIIKNAERNIMLNNFT